MREVAASADAERFTGRDAELAAIADLLDSRSPSRILFVHGPGGIGKSSLLRAAGRLAEERGFVIARLDGRTLPAEPERVVSQMAAVGGECLCLLIDEVDHLGPGLLTLREQLVDQLPGSARLLLAGRRAPSVSWREDGFDAVFVSMLLGPLPDDDAERLLRSRGVDEEHVPGILRWAQGSPLALSVAGSSLAGPPVRSGRGDLERRLIEWLAGHEILEVPREILEVAALARTVDARVLAAALPSRATRSGMRQLAALPVTERVGDLIAVHAVLAAAIRDRLAADEPRRAAELVRRIAEHLATRARLGEMDALIRLSRLVETPALREAIGNEPSETYYADIARSGELVRFGSANGFDGGEDWGEILAWFERWPEQTVLIRHVEGPPVMFSSFVPVALLSPEGPVAAALHAAAEQTDADPARSFAGVVMFAEGPPEAAAAAARLGAGAFMLQRRVGDTQSMLIHYPSPDRRPGTTSAIARELEGPLPRPVALSDFRPLGVVGMVEAMVLGERGFEPRPADPAVLLAEDDDPDRIAALRARLDSIFGASESDQRLRRAIELVHLGERADEAECLAALSVSRRTWFRLLRTARERVLAHR
ncbi:MAG TPA: ATP-binding protein [Marmoricola sp.]|nr:ATP-binding protein [Marmoricola sp.]